MPGGKAGPGWARSAGPGKPILDELLGPGGIDAAIAARRAPLVDNAVAQSPDRTPGLIERLGIARLMGAPLLEGQVVGVLTASRAVGEPPYTAADLAVLQSLAEQAAVATHNARRYQALRTSEQQFRSLAENMREMVFSLDAQGRLTYVNRRAAELLGYSQEELVGRGPVGFLTPESAAEALRRFTRAMAGQEPTSTYEVEMVARDGTLVPVELSVVTMEAEGRPAGRHAVARDLRRQRAEEVQRLRDEKQRALGQLAGGVAHDLNQSLALISSHAELALEALQAERLDREDLIQLVGTVLGAALDGGETVKRLLTFARGGGEGPAGQVDLATLLHDVARLTAPQWRDTAQAEGRPIALVVDVDGEVTVPGWAASLREALTNLVFNAVEAMPQGGTITLRAARRGPEALIEVSDTGMGMPPDVQARCLEPYFTTKGKRGSGLGLAQVFNIVRRHDGHVEVHSTEGQGTTFRLWLSSASRAVSREGMNDEGRSGPSPHGSRPATRCSILVVDDEPGLAQVAARILRRDGHVVAVAHSGEEALQVLAPGGVDVVVSDVTMGPGINGWQLAEQVRQRWPQVSIVLATGWGGTADAAYAQRVDALLDKPYRAEELRQVIRQLRVAGG